jgi:hypothetical protein
MIASLQKAGVTSYPWSGFWTSPEPVAASAEVNGGGRFL